MSALIGIALGAGGIAARADSMQLVNGDRYSGRLLSVNQSNVVFQSEIQGVVVLPRAKVAQISFQNAVALNTPTPPATPPPDVYGPPIPPTVGISEAGSTGGAIFAMSASHTNSLIQQIRQKGVDPKLLGTVEDQVLSQATPETRQMFKDMVGGLMTGSLSVGDVRAQAVSSIKDLKEAKKTLGKDGDDVLDGYLAILEKFVQETEATPPTKTTGAVKAP